MVGLNTPLQVGADNYAVWRSLWEVMTTGDPEASESQQARSVLKRALWHQGNGYAHLLAQGAVLPSGLGGHYRVLTSLQSTKFVIRGLLTDQATFESVASWPFFKAYGSAAPGSIRRSGTHAAQVRSMGATVSSSHSDAGSELGSSPWTAGEQRQRTAFGFRREP